MYECLLSTRHHALRLSTIRTKATKSAGPVLDVCGCQAEEGTDLPQKRMCEVKLGLGWAPSTPQLGFRPQCLFPLAWSQKEVQVISLSSVYKVWPLSLEQVKTAIIQSIQNLYVNLHIQFPKQNKLNTQSYVQL